MLPIVLTIFAITLAGVIQGERSIIAPSIQPSVAVRAATVRIFKVSPSDAGLMLPAVDLQGNVWFGEMATNRLARLDASTGRISSWAPPGGEDGIMGMTIDRGGNVWFAEANANYIGRFDPARQSFSTFSLGRDKSQRVGLEDVQFDSLGNLWFTETVAGRIGRLDPLSGTLHSWVLPPFSPGTPSYPFGLAVTPGGQVWFGTYTGGVVGRLDPQTGRVLLFHLASPAEQIYSMAADAQGHIWYTELQFGKLGMIDSTTGKVTELRVPAMLGNPEDLHSIVVAHGDIWLTSSGANALVRYSPDEHAFTFFRLSVPASTPFGLAHGPADTLWFTAGGNPINYVGAMKVPP
jgi:virginiamycin B lyase